MFYTDQKVCDSISTIGSLYLTKPRTFEDGGATVYAIRHVSQLYFSKSTCSHIPIVCSEYDQDSIAIKVL